MKKVLYALVFSLLLLLNIYGNSHNNNDTIRNLAIPQFAIKVLPSGMINFTEPSFQIAVEHKVFKDITLQHTGGLIYNYSSTHAISDYAYRNITETKGFIARSEARFYVNSRYSNYEGKYFGFDVMYKYIQQDKEKFFSRYSGAYDELINFKRIKHVMALHLMAGYQVQAGNTPFIFNFYGGLGLRAITITVKDLPEDVYEYYLSDYYIFERENGNYIMPSLMGGVKIGFAFK